MAASMGQDPTYDPAESVTALQESSTPTHKIKKYIVYESCIMELFAACPVCTWACDVRTRNLGTFLSVEQRCPHCEFCRHWNSQPILGSTPAGNLHLSAAVYLSGASFIKIARSNEVGGSYHMEKEGQMDRISKEKGCQILQKWMKASIITSTGLQPPHPLGERVAK